MEVRIQSVGFTADQKLRDFIEQKLNKLSRLSEKLTHVDVFLKLDSKSKSVNDKSAQIKLNLPRKTIIAEGHGKKFEMASNEAIENLRRQVQRYKEKLRA